MAMLSKKNLNGKNHSNTRINIGSTFPICSNLLLVKEMKLDMEFEDVSSELHICTGDTRFSDACRRIRMLAMYLFTCEVILSSLMWHT